MTVGGSRPQWPTDKLNALPSAIVKALSPSIADRDDAVTQGQAKDGHSRMDRSHAHLAAGSQAGVSREGI